MEQVNTQSNKSMIWDILYKNNIFNNLSENDISSIVKIIDDIIYKTTNDVSLKDKTIIQLNKIIISQVNIAIIEYKNTPKSILKSSLKHSMQTRFEEVKRDLDNTITLPKPIDINFQDDISYNNDNLDKQLEELVKRRNSISNFTTNISNNLTITDNNLSLVYDKSDKTNTENNTENNIKNNIEIINLLNEIKINQERIINLLNK